MTSQVKTSAHCASNKEVVVRVTNIVTGEQIEEYVLQNGESRELAVWDDRAVTSFERLKEVPAAE